MEGEVGKLLLLIRADKELTERAIEEAVGLTAKTVDPADVSSIQRFVEGLYVEAMDRRIRLKGDGFLRGEKPK